MKPQIYFRKPLQIIGLLLLMLMLGGQQLWAQCGAVSSYVPTVSSTTICSGNQLYVYATGLPVTRWVYRDNNTGNWINIGNNSDNISQYLSASVLTTRSYRAVVSTSSCPTDTTAAVSVIITPLTYGNNNTITLSSTTNQVCSGSQFSLRIMNEGVNVNSWIYRDNNGPWYTYTNSTSQNINIYAPSTSVTLNREFKVLLKNSISCVVDSSAGINIIISPSTAGYNNNVKPVATQTSVCGGTSVSLQIEWPFEIGNWIYKDAGSSTWQNFTSNSTNAFDYNTNISTSGLREYRVVLKNPGNCTADTSDACFVMINASVKQVLTSIQPRLNGTNTEVCAGSSMSFQIVGYNNGKSWIYRDSLNGIWNVFSSSSSPSLSSNNNITKDLNREVKVIINNSSTTCSYDTSASVFYKVKANIKGYTTSAVPHTPIDVLCIGAQPTIYMQNGQTVSGWFYRDNGIGAWVNSFNSGNTYYDGSTGNLSQNTTRSYRAVINNTALCRIDTTPEITIDYKVATPRGVIAITPNISKSSYCSGAYINGNISLSNNMQVAKWIYKDNNATTWLDMQNSSGTNFYDYNTTVTSSTTRTYKAIIRSLETFSLDTSLELVVNINPQTRGNINITPTSLMANVCNQNNVQLSLVPAAGYTTNNWIYRDTVTSVWYNAGSSSNTLNNYVSSNNSQRFYRAILLDASMCKYDTTNVFSINVLKKTVRNNASFAPTTTKNDVCSGTTYYLNANLPSGVSASSWIYRDNGSAWQSANTYESSTSTRVLVPTVREYKVVVNDNNNCFSDTSAAVSVNISPLTNGAIVNITPTATSSIVCSGSTVNANFTYNGTVQKWVYRDNGGVWNELLSGSSSNSLYDYNVFVNTNTSREYRAYLVRPNSCIIDTTQNLTLQVRAYGNGNAAAIQPTTTAPNVCSGNTVNASIQSGNGYSVHKWIYRNSPTEDWRDFTNSTASTYLSETVTPVVSNTLRTYRAIIKTNTCSYDTTAQVSVQLNARSYGYASATTVTSNTGVYCSSATVNVNVVSGTMPSGANIRSWLFMDNNSGVWNVIPNYTSTSLSHTNTAVTVPTTRAYRVVINNTNTCSYDSSSLFSVSINPSGAGYASTITPTVSTTSVCNAQTNPNVFVSLPSGYSMVNWLVNNNNTGWSGFGYPTTTTSITDYNTAVQTAVSRSYRAIVLNNNTCSLDSTNIIGISINPTTGGVLSNVTPTSARTNYCYTKSVSANVSIPSGYTIQKWIYSDNNGSWNDFTNNTTSSNLTDNNTFVSALTSRSYSVIMLNSNTCQRDTTSALTVILSPRSNNIGTRAITPTSSQSNGVCSGSSINLNVQPGIGNELLKWTYSDNGTNGPWVDALNSYNSTSFTHQLTNVNNLTARLYRAIISDTSTCDLDSTNAIAINIRPITYGTDATITVTGPDSVCVGSNVSLSVSPGSGNAVTKWIYKDNNGAWNNFINNTQSNSLNDNSAQLTAGFVRTYSPLILKTSICRIDTLANVKAVNFKNKTYGNSNNSVNITLDTVCAGSNLVATTSGSVERWLFRDGVSGNWNTIATASTYLSDNSTGVTASGWRYYRALFNTGSCNADSSKIDSVYLKIQTRGNIAVVPTTSNSTVCAGNNVTINLSVPNATMQMWLYRDNGVGAWSILSYTTSFGVTDYNTYVSSPISRQYRAIVLRTCSYDTTNAITVTITPKTNGTDLTKVPTASSTSVCTASNVQNIQVNAGSGNTIISWLWRDNGGLWKVFASGNQNNLTDYNTLVGTTVTRNYVAIINNNTTCKFDTSAMLTVTINPVVLGNSNRTVTVPSTICMTNSYNVSLNVSSDTTVLRFLSNYNNGPWYDEGYINPTNNASISRYAYTGTPYTIGYRAITYKASNCHIDTTAPVVLAVNPRTYGNDNSIVPTGNNSSCTSTAFNLNANIGSGNTASHWVYSDDGINWIPYYTSATNISVNVNTNTIINRQYRVIVIKANSCSIDTSAAKSITINPIVNGYDSTSQINISTGASVCIGSSININTNPSPNSISRWLYNDNNTGWLQMYQTNSSISDVNTFVSSTVNRIYSAIIWKQATCRMDTITKTDTIAITPRTYGVDNSVVITPSSNSVCVGNAITLSVNAGSHTVQTWYYSDNGGAWNVLSTSTSSSIIDYNTGVSISTSRMYKALIKKSNACAFDTTQAITVSINPRLVGVDNNITPTVANATLCAGSNIVVSVTPGIGNSIQKWIYRQNGGAWMDYSYTQSTSIYDYNTNVTSSTTREYRAIITKGSGCATDTSKLVLVTINPIGFGNQNAVVPVATKTAICSGSNVTLSVGGFSGASIARWLYRDGNAGAWTIINSGATSITDFNTQTSTQITRQYRALINNTVSGCSTDSTAVTSVTFNPITNGTLPIATTVSQATVCAGSPVNVLINPGAGKVVSSWLYQNVGMPWMVLSNTSATSINDFNTNVSSNTSRMYRAILSNTAGCSLDSSQAVVANINIISAGTNLSITPNTSTPNLCSGSNAILSVSGFSGTVVQWLYRDSVNENWNPIYNTNFTLFHSSTFVSYPRTRTYRAIVYNANNCSNDTTAQVQMQINPQLAGNANAIAPTASATKACSGSTVNLTATGFINGGTVVGWVFSDDNITWNRISGSSSQNISIGINVTGPVTRMVRALVLTGCNTDTTAAVTLTLDELPAKPTVTNNAGTDSLVCTETATAYQWFLNGNVIPGAINKVHVATVNGVYTVQVANTAECKSTSNNYTHFLVGLENIFANTKFMVYPNPTNTGIVTIQWQGLAVSNATIYVTDMLGKLVLQNNLDVQSNDETSIDLSQQNGGMYFVTITANGQSITRKVSYVK